MIFRSKKEVAAPAQPAVPLARPSSVANGKPPQAAAGTSAGASRSDEEQRRAIAVAKMSLAFAEVVSVLMRSSTHKHLSLADLEWLVVPPLLTAQWSVAKVKPKQGGPEIPMAVALWASLSAEVDKRLSENLNAPIRLRPDEWKSGDILWLIEAVGDRHVAASLLKELGTKTFKDRPVKMRTRDEGGQLIVRSLADLFAGK